MSIEATLQPPRTMLEVFKSLPEGTLVQLIENNIVMSPAPLTRHQSISIELSSELFYYVRSNKIGKVFSAPFDVHLDNNNIFQPDICFIGNEKLPLLKKDGFYGAPDLIIEILSPGTAKYDLVDKKDVYEHSGVSELWFIDPADNSVTGYSLVNNTFQPIFTGNGRLDLKLLDLALNF
jgi:Uma2 family endonuclease